MITENEKLYFGLWDKQAKTTAQEKIKRINKINNDFKKGIINQQEQQEFKEVFEVENTTQNNKDFVINVNRQK